LLVFLKEEFGCAPDKPDTKDVDTLGTCGKMEELKDEDGGANRKDELKNVVYRT